MMPTLKITSEQDGKRLDLILARQYPDYSRSFLQKWIREGRVTRGGHNLIPNYRVRAGETIDVVSLEPEASPEDPTLSGMGKGWATDRLSGTSLIGKKPPTPTILFEDKSILVLNKPANLVVHPAPSHKGPTLVDWLESYLGPKVTGLFADSSRLGVVHRLDKDTTGVLLVAKTVTAQNNISKQFQDRVVKKSYAAFIQGIPEAVTGIITAPVGRSKDVPSRMAVSSAGRPSETSFEVVKSFKEVSQLNLHPKTGRTHQIRVHCAAIGHPIIGDRTYGASDKWAKEFGIMRPLLHAERLEINHPVTKKKVSFVAPWPADMKKALTMFKKTMKFVLVASWFISATQRLRAEEGAARPATKAHATHSSSSSGSSSSGSSQAASSAKALKKEMASIQTQFKALIEEVSALQDKNAAIQASLDDLGASRRLRDIEKAISDLNGKAANSSNITEETKSQMLDMSRKVKSQQEVLDQMRDQIDRLQRELIQAKAHQERVAPTQTDPASNP